MSLLSSLHKVSLFWPHLDGRVSWQVWVCMFYMVYNWKFHSTSVPCLKEKAQIITDVPELIRYGPGLLEDDSDMPLATLGAV